MSKVSYPISVDHIARIEGKAGIEISFTGTKVDVVHVNVFEGPRYFEAITVGKPLEDAVAVYPRICSFCSAAHKVTAVQAAEAAIGLQPTEQTRKLRELLYIGDYIESHALHLFLLALPDFLGYHDAFTLGKDHPSIIESGMILKDIGADIQTLLGSRYIHQENVLIGGYGKLPSKEQLESILKRLKGIHNQAEEALEHLVSFRNWPEADGDRVHLALQPFDATYSMLGNQVSASDGETFKVDAYKVRITEQVVSHSFAKHSMYKGKPFMTCALSRLTLFRSGMDGRARELAEMYESHLDPNNPMSNNFAQAIELIYFVHRAENIVEQLLADFKPYEKRIRPKIAQAGTGVSISEAPRGLLAYTIRVDKNGVVKAADIITPTAMFLPMLEDDLRRTTEAFLQQGVKDPKVLAEKIQTIVRAYDPCVSCSVHLAEVKD